MTDPPRSHLGTDWKDQWARVQGWHERVGEIAAFGAKDASLAGDDIYAFFMNCYHLRDWLKASHERGSSVDRFVSRSDALRWARDICNGMKHFKIDPTWSTTTRPTWSTASEPVTLTRVTTAWRPGDAIDPAVVPADDVDIYSLKAMRTRPEPVRGEHWSFTSGLESRDMFWLADACISDWSRFLKGHPGRP